MASDKKSVSKLYLRMIIEDELAPTIELHRSSREQQDKSYDRPSGPATDDEIDDFILSNPLFDEETVEQLIDPGFLGFGFASAEVTPAILANFRDLARQWAKTNEWIAADLIPYHNYLGIEADETHIWNSEDKARPGWLIRTPSVLILAAELLKKGQLLSELTWRQFEEVVGEILELEGWTVDVTRPSKDGGIDLYASRVDASVGSVKTLWQAKKYGEQKKVRLSDVRELSGVLHNSGLTKGILVTTSRLTRGALEWVRQDIYRLDYKDKEQVEAWIKKHA